MESVGFLSRRASQEPFTKQAPEQFGGLFFHRTFLTRKSGLPQLLAALSWISLLHACGWPSLEKQTYNSGRKRPEPEQ